MRVYISGPITAMENLNIEAFNAAERRLRLAGHEPINPHKICADIYKGAGHDVFMARCLPELRTCAAIVALPGYTGSIGTALEHKEAELCGIPLLSIDYLEGKSSNHGEQPVAKVQ